MMPHTILDILYFGLLVIAPLPLIRFLLWNLQGWIPNHSYPEGNFSFRFVAVVLMVVWLAIQAMVSLVLGMAGILTKSALLFTELFLASIGFILLTRGRVCWKILPLEFLWGLSWLEKAALLAIGITGLVLWGNASCEPITNFDTLSYHLPNMAHWFQTGSLNRVAGLGQISYYPYHWELIATLFLFPFHTDFQATFPNLAAFGIWTASIYALSRELGARRLACLVSAGLAGLLPILLNQYNSLHVDLPFAALFLASLYFLAHFLRSYQVGSLLLLLISIGLLAGIKMSAVGYIGILVLAGLFLFFTNQTYRSQFWFNRRILIAVVLGGLAFLIVIGGYWYAINWIETGNPLGQVNLRVGPVTIFHGSQNFDDYLKLIYPHFPELDVFIENMYGSPANFDELMAKTSLLHVMNWTSRDDWKTIISQIWEQGGLPTVILSVGALFTLPGLNKPAPTQSLQIAVLGVLVLTLILYLLTPYGGDNGSHGWRVTSWVGQAYRYGLPCVGLLAALAAGGYNRWRLLSALMVIPLTILSIQAAWNYSAGMPLLLVFVSLVAVSLTAGLLLHKHPALALVALAVSLILVLLTMPNLAKEREQRRLLLFNGLEPFLISHTQSNEKIGYLMTFFSYPLYTAEIDRQAIFAPAYSNSRDEWVKNLQEQDIRIVSIGPFGSDEWKKTREYAWLEDFGGPFERIFGGDPNVTFVLYRLK